LDQYFWRTTQQQEIDLIEDTGSSLNAFEFKWNEKTVVRFPQTFISKYPNTVNHIVSPNNLEEFITQKAQSRGRDRALKRGSIYFFLEN